MTETPLPEIPWTKEVTVTTDRENVIGLKNGHYTADIWRHNFEWSISVDSREMIKDFLKEDEPLTRSLQEYFSDSRGEFMENVKNWLKGNTKPLPKGPKEWRPRAKTVGKLFDDGEPYRHGYTAGDDTTYWWGGEFEYASVDLEEGGEGVVIAWNGSGVPHFYKGRSFEDFMNLQYEGEPYSAETFLHFNTFFDNAFMWAWERMGVFDHPEEAIDEWTDDHVQQVEEAVRQDPLILLPESVDKILLNLEAFPDGFREAARWVAGQRFMELEKARGQKLIWGDLYE